VTVIGAMCGSDVDGKQLCEKILYFKMLCFRSCNFKIIACCWSPGILQIALLIMLPMAVYAQAANDLSVNWNWSFHTSRPQWLTIRQGRFYDLALMTIERDETTKAYFDEVMDDLASIRARELLF